MKTAIIMGGLVSLCVMVNSGIASAADFIYDDYEERIFQDHSYIDKSLDDFDKRVGRYNHRTDYADLQSNRDYSGKGDSYSTKPHDHKHDANGNCIIHDDVATQNDVIRKCMHPRKIRRTLIQQGWHEFKFLKEGPRRIRMLATDYDGQRFKLVVDRCRGSIIRHRPMRRFSRWPVLKGE